MRPHRPVIPPAVAERIRNLPPGVKRSVREAIRAIALDPACGEPLRRELSAYRKFRVRRYSVVYGVDRNAGTITVVAVGHRRTIYEDAAATARPRARR